MKKVMEKSTKRLIHAWYKVSFISWKNISLKMKFSLVWVSIIIDTLIIFFNKNNKKEKPLGNNFIFHLKKTLVNLITVGVSNWIYNSFKVILIFLLLKLKMWTIDNDWYVDIFKKMCKNFYRNLNCVYQNLLYFQMRT